MSTLMLENFLFAPLPALPRNAGSLQEEQIRVSVQLVLQREPLYCKKERRQHERHPYPHPIHLTPLGAEQQPLPDATLVVIGRHLSEQGLGLYYPSAIPFRRGIVSLRADGDEWIGLLFELLWTRYNRHGWYDSGGRFLAVVESPLGRES